MLTASLPALQLNKRVLIPAVFLQKTYEILENSDYSNIISWNEEGDAFAIRDANGFSENILPKFFKHNNYQSFVRQLNMYDFHKYRKNEESFFKHPYFKRGYKTLLNKIKRKTNVNFVSSYSIQEYFPSQDSTPEIKELLYGMKSKQGELEQALTYMITQNLKLLNENKRLWRELIKKKLNNKEDNKEKFLHFFLENVADPHNMQTTFFDELKRDNNGHINTTKNPEWSGLSGEQDCLMQRLFSSLCPNNNKIKNVSFNSKRIKKTKSKIFEKLRERLESKLQNKADHGQIHNGFNYSQIEDVWKGNENQIEESNINQEQPVIYNIHSPSAFLNISNSQEEVEEEEHKKTNDTNSFIETGLCDFKKNEEIFINEVFETAKDQTPIFYDQKV